MAKGAVVTALFVAVSACGSRTTLDAGEVDASPEPRAGAASASAGTNATAGSSGTGGSSGVPQPCTIDVVTQPDQMFPASSSPPGPIDAVVLTVSDTNLQLVTAQGDATFGWVGPSLVDRLATGEVVELMTPPAWFVAEAPFWNILKARSVTLLTVHTSIGFGEPSAMPAAVVPFRSFGNLPQFELVDVGCCRVDAQLVCEYSALTAALAGQSVRIEKGDTAALGQWQITNLGAVYTNGTLSFAFTALGPALVSN